MNVEETKIKNSIIVNLKVIFKKPSITYLSLRELPSNGIISTPIDELEIRLLIKSGKVSNIIN